MRKIQIVSKSQKEQFERYFFEYLTELSQFDPTIKFDKDGRPIYKWLDCYWTDKNRYPFYLIVDEEIAGVALVRDLENKQFEIAEFYINPQYRNDGNGLWFANQLTELFDGEFLLSTEIINQKAMKFWEKVAKIFKNSQINEDETRKYWILKK